MIVCQFNPDTMRCIWPVEDDVKPLRFVFTRSHMPLSAAIRAAAWWAPWSHCATLVSDEWVVESRFVGGVQAERRSALYLRSSAVQVLALPCRDPQAGRDRARSKIGAKYDWRGFLSLPFRERDWQQAHRWYCSEQCADDALHAGVELVSPDHHGIHPSSLYRLMWAAGARPEN